MLPNVLFWLEDILMHHASVQGMTDEIAKIFSLFKKIKRKLHIYKCCFFATTLHWSGRFFSRDGIKLDQRRIEDIQKMEIPETGAHPQEFVCALKWVKNDILNFAALDGQLQRFLKNVYGCANSLTK